MDMLNLLRQILIEWFLLHNPYLYLVYVPGDQAENLVTYCFIDQIEILRMIDLKTMNELVILRLLCLLKDSIKNLTATAAWTTPTATATITAKSRSNTIGRVNIESLRY